MGLIISSGPSEVRNGLTFRGLDRVLVYRVLTEFLVYRVLTAPMSFLPIWLALLMGAVVGEGGGQGSDIGLLPLAGLRTLSPGLG